MPRRAPKTRSRVLYSWPLGLLLLTSTIAVAGAAPCDRATFHTVLDVGHTPQAPGAISARGVPEYDFNLRLAQRIEREMQARGYAKTTLLLTQGEQLPGLIARVASANAAKADLFISIHHDSVPEALLANWDFLGAAGRHNDQFKGHSIFVSNQHQRYARSLAFARTLGLALKSRGLEYTPHYTDRIMGARRRQLIDREAGVYRFDRLYVLMQTKMPAVLLEAGSIIHRDEELLMESPERQAQIAEAVTDAVEKFCAARRTSAPKLKTN
jgi:N-acetylmuramoyl-L-alanine amidase